VSLIEEPGPISAIENLRRESSRQYSLLSLVSFAAMVLLSLILFTITENGKDKFGMAICGLLILIPLGALVSFCSSFYNLRYLSNQTPWPEWLPQSMPILYFLTLVGIAVVTVALMALGEFLGFYGIIAAWTVLWAGISFALNYR